MMPRPLMKWRREDYERICDEYRAKLRRLSNDNLH
ncbi:MULTISPECIES: hypothetical protein [unclassified Photorhabdus]